MHATDGRRSNTSARTSQSTQFAKNFASSACNVVSASTSSEQAGVVGAMQAPEHRMDEEVGNELVVYRESCSVGIDRGPSMRQSSHSKARLPAPPGDQAAIGDEDAMPGKAAERMPV